MTLLLINRDPEPGETNIPRDTSITVEITTTLALTIDAANTQIYVEGVLAFDGGVFQPGFTGATSTPFSNLLRVTIVPATEFSSEQVVDVRVVSQDSGPTETIDEVYSFTVEDFAPPRVTSAQARDLDVVRVVFSEPMGDLAEDPTSYTFTRMPGADQAAANVVAESVEKINDSTFDVTTDIELTPGITYMVTVANAEDENGNAIAAPFDTALFTAFVPAKPSGRDLTFFNLFPQINRTEDLGGTRDLLKISSVVQDVIDILLTTIDRFTDIFDPDVAPEQFIDQMLFGLGNPFTFELTLADKRRLLRVLVQIYKLKGTAIGIESVVRFFLGLDVLVEPIDDIDGWVLGDSELGEDTVLSAGDLALLYSFEIISGILLTDQQRDQIEKIANYMKPAHTHLIRFVEPTVLVLPDHWELGVSELGVDSFLH